MNFLGFLKPHRLIALLGVFALVCTIASAAGTDDDKSDHEPHEKKNAAAAGEHGESKHGGEHGEHHGPKPLLDLPEFLPNFVSFFTLHPSMHDYTIIQWLHIYMWENIVFSLLTAGLMVGGIMLLLSLARGPTSVPTRSQTLLEMVFESLDNMVCGIIGPEGRKYTPFIGTLFLYIWCMNMQGMVPGLKAPTSYIGVTLGLSITVFIYVQLFVGIKENGFGGWLYHLAGSPQDKIGWGMAPVMFVLHVIGEFVKPISLALRLFGNILGEDSLIGVFGLLGIVLLSTIAGGPTTIDGMLGLQQQYNVAELAWWQWFGIPLQLPILMLSLLLGTIQALVFSLLSTIYIFLMLPHGDHGNEEHEHGQSEEHSEAAHA